MITSVHYRHCSGHDTSAKCLCQYKSGLLSNQPMNISVCYNCHNPGHVARDCTEERACYRCKQTGHSSKECPEENPRYEKTCYVCGDPGHLQSACPSTECYRYVSALRCRLILRFLATEELEALLFRFGVLKSFVPC